MSSQLKLWIFRAAMFLFWSLGIFFWGRSCSPEANPTVSTIVQTETVTIRDTVIVEAPKLVRHIVRDTIRVPVRDTVVRNDTTYLRLPREVKTYSDERYTAVVSGFKPSLDRLEIYTNDQVITHIAIPEPAKRKRWGLGVQIGAGAVPYNSTIRIAPYIGVGLSYDIIQW